MTERQELQLFVCGDVMTGRGVDQILPRSCPPELRESVVGSAMGYVVLAEQVNGPIPRSVDYAYVWGAANEEWSREQAHVRIINLETSVTTREQAEPKGINYRMHPDNVPVLTGAGIDCCVVANNHVLDWGQAGLLETLETLTRAGMRVAGAGQDLQSAQAPALLETPSGSRVVVVGLASMDSGVPRDWAATPSRPGVHLIFDFSDRAVEQIASLVRPGKRAGDIAVASIHWGGNWGYEIASEHRRFAQGLVDRAGIDVVHGHSSHHPKAIEVYRDRLILYGCGDFLNDYEGIRTHENFRHDLVLMYFVTLDRADGHLVRLRLKPLQIRQFSLQHPSSTDRVWLRDTLAREYRRFGGRLVASEGGWELDWQRS